MWESIKWETTSGTAQVMSMHCVWKFNKAVYDKIVITIVPIKNTACYLPSTMSLVLHTRNNTAATNSWYCSVYYGDAYMLLWWKPELILGYKLRIPYLFDQMLICYCSGSQNISYKLRISLIKCCGYYYSFFHCSILCSYYSRATFISCQGQPEHLVKVSATFSELKLVFSEIHSCRF